MTVKKRFNPFYSPGTNGFPQALFGTGGPKLPLLLSSLFLSSMSRATFPSQRKNFIIVQQKWSLRDPEKFSHMNHTPVLSRPMKKN